MKQSNVETKKDSAITENAFDNPYNYKIVSLLLDFKMPVTDVALFRAAWSLPILKLIVGKAKINLAALPEFEQSSLLGSAMRDRSGETVHYLAQHGLPTNANVGFFAAAFEENVPLMERYLKQGADLSHADAYSVMHLIWNQMLPEVQYMLEHGLTGVSPLAESKFGQGYHEESKYGTILAYTAADGPLDILKLLLQHHAILPFSKNPDKQQLSVYWPLFWSILNGRPDNLQILLDQGISLQPAVNDIIKSFKNALDSERGRANMPI